MGLLGYWCIPITSRFDVAGYGVPHLTALDAGLLQVGSQRSMGRNQTREGKRPQLIAMTTGKNRTLSTVDKQTDGKTSPTPVRPKDDSTRPNSTPRS